MIIITDNFLSLLYFAIATKEQLERERGLTGESAELAAWKQYAATVEEDGDREIKLMDR